MRFINDLTVRGAAAWGLQMGDGVVDSQRLGADVPATMQALIEACSARPALFIEVEIEGIGVLRNPVL